jgi:hypothetical protein
VLSLLASAPALPLDEAGKYVAGAYVVFLVLIVVYVAIMAMKLQRIERELRDLAGFAEAAQGSQGGGARPGGSGPEAEQPPVDETKPSSGPGHDLIPPGPDDGRADHSQGVPHV